MITAYRVKYLPATINTGARFNVTRLDDKKTYRTTYDYAAISAERQAVNEAFGEDPARLECVGRISKTESIFAIHH
jgi:hypothetical protein